MTADHDFQPDWGTHPGAMLNAILQNQGVRQSELAERTGLSAKHVNQIIKQAIGISPDIAILLERALNVPADFWVGADTAYQTFESRQRANRALDGYQGWARRFDSQTLLRHGVLEVSDDGASRVEKILKLFQVATPDAFEQFWQRPSVSFRRSQAFAINEPNTALWIRLVERCALDVPVGVFNLRALRVAARRLPAMTTMAVPNGFVAARAALAEAGVALTFVREVPGTRVCAATWWINSDRPAIGVTERHRRSDIFWFNLIHEVGHVLLHPRRASFISLDDPRDSTDPAEKEADAFADELLFPGASSVEIAQARSHRDLILIAARLGIGVPTVAGRYAHLTKKWKTVGRLRGTIREAEVTALEMLAETAAS